jgi:hypothetical protein
LATFVICKKTAQRKQSPDRRKFSQSGNSDCSPLSPPLDTQTIRFQSTISFFQMGFFLLKRLHACKASVVYIMWSNGKTGWIVLRAISCYETLRGSEWSRVARFCLTQYTKTGENIPNDHNITQWPNSIILDGCKIFQMTIKCTSLFNYKALKHFPKCLIFGWIIYHLATLEWSIPIM